MGTENLHEKLKSLFRGFLSESDVFALLQRLKTPPLNSYVRINKVTCELKCALDSLEQFLEEDLNKRGISDRFQIEQVENFSDIIKIPPLGPYDVGEIGKNFIVVDRACGESVLRGADVYASGILATSRFVDQNTTVSILVNICNNITQGSILNEPVGTLIAKGKLVQSRDQILKEKSGLAVLITSSEYIKPSLNNVLVGVVFPQNFSSLMVSHSLEIGENFDGSILDMCSAPGGKTLHAASLCNDKCVIYSIESNRNRYALLQKNVSDSGCINVKTMLADSSKIRPSEQGKLASDAFDENYVYNLKTNQFKRIILDPPCSGFGKRPCLDIEIPTACYRSLQFKLLEIAWKLLETGGILVYSTCSILIEENEDVIAEFILKYGDAEILPVEIIGATEGFPVNNMECLKKCRRYGLVDFDSPGFFIAKIQKKVVQ